MILHFFRGECSYDVTTRPATDFAASEILIRNLSVKGFSIVDPFGRILVIPGATFAGSVRPHFGVIHFV